MTSPLEQIKALLPKLDAAGLGEVRAAIGALLQFGGGEASHASPTGRPRGSGDDVDLVLEEIAAFLRSEGVEYVSPDTLRRVQGFGAFAAKVAPTMQFIRKVSTNRTKVRAMLRVCCVLLYKDLRRMQISATTRTLMSHWHRVPSVINRNFPGYGRAGLLHLLIQEEGSSMLLRDAPEDELE